MSITFTAGPASANFSNSNAHALMLAMGIEPEPCGSMDGPEFNRRAWDAFSADDQTLSRWVRPTTTEPRFVSFGLDIQDLRDRLFQLASLGTDYPVTWS